MVRLDVFVDSAFQEWFRTWTPSSKPLDTCDVNDPTGGGHAVVQTGIIVSTTGDGVLDILNSWGSIGAPPIVAEGPNTAGHLRATFRWFQQAVQQATVWKCSRAVQ